MAETVRYHSDLERIDWPEVDQLFQKAGLGGRDPQRYPEACRRSYSCVFAERDGHIIGIGRLLSDGYAASAIFDVAVLPEHQGQGIGRRIMELLHERLPSPRCLIYAVAGKEGFYEKLGYHRSKTGMLKVGNIEKARELGLI